MTTSLQSLFGELRGALNKPLTTREDRRLLLQFLAKCRKTSPDQYDDQWVPYIWDHAHMLPEPFQAIATLDEAERLVELIPPARFKLSLTHHKKTQLHSLNRVWSTLTHNPKLRHICAISLYDLSVSLTQLTQLLQSPHLHELKELDLGKMHNTLSLHPIITSTRLEHLQTLNLQTNYNIDDKAIQQLIHTRSLPRLRTLILGDIRTYQTTIDALHDAPNLPNLDTIHIHPNYIIG